MHRWWTGGRLGVVQAPHFYRNYNKELSFILTWSTHQDKTLIDWVSSESVGFPAFNFVVYMINFVAAGSHIKNRSLACVLQLFLINNYCQ